MMKKSIIAIITLFFCLDNIAQTENKGFLPDSCSYMVLSQPSERWKNAQMVYGNNFRFPFLMADGKMILVSNDDVKDPVAFALPDDVKDCEEFIIVDSLIVCKKGNIIKGFDGEKVDDVLIMPDERYNIYPANEGLFYLAKHKTDSSSVYLVQAATSKLLKLFDTPFAIDNIAGTGLESFVTSGRMIYFVSKDVCTLVEVADSRVQSIDFCSDGAFYSTEKACYYMGIPGKSYPFLLGDIKQVMLVDNRLYMLFSDGLFSVIDRVNQYQIILDKIVNEVNKNKNDEKR